MALVLLICLMELLLHHNKFNMGRLRKYELLIAFALGGKISYAQQTADSVLTLQQCIDIGIKNNLQVKQTAAQTEASRIYWQQAKENLLPTLGGDINHSYSQGRSLNPFTNGYLDQPITSGNYNLSSSLTLSSGLTLQNSIKQTALAYQAGKMDLEQAKNDLTLNLITAYFKVLNGEDQLELAKTQASVSQKQLERAEVLDKDGAISPQQLYDLKGQAATDQLSIINAQNSISIAKLDLLQSLNVPYNKNIKLQRKLSDQITARYQETAEQVYNTALNNFAFVKSGTLKRQSAERALMVAKGTLLPSLYLTGGLSTTYSSAAQRSILINQSIEPTNQFIQTAGGGRETVYTTQSNYIGQNINYTDQLRNNYRTFIGIGLSVPILNAFQNRNKVSLAKINLQTAKDVEQTNQLQLKVNIDKAYENMNMAFDRYQLLLIQTDAFTESFRIAENRFNAGAITSVDFLIVKGNLDRARTNLVNARYDYLIRTRILDYYTGQLEVY